MSPCKSSKNRTITIITAIVVAAVILVVVVAIISYVRGGQAKKAQFKKAQDTKVLTKFDYNLGQNEAQSPEHNNKGENEKLQFVRNDRQRFEMTDLLRASAEVLGSGSFGSSYKAVLLSGPALVVKRFRQMDHVRKQDFHDHMARIGSLSHRNLLPLVSFYYRKEEKLLISDFVPNGSLANLLHGNFTSLPFVFFLHI